MHLAEEFLASVSEVGAKQFNTLRVDILGAGSVVLRLNVGHLVSETLAVEVLLRVHRLVKHNLPGHDDAVVALLFAGGECIAIILVADCETVLVVGVDHFLGVGLDVIEGLSVKSRLHPL